MTTKTKAENLRSIELHKRFKEMFGIKGEDGFVQFDHQDYWSPGDLGCQDEGMILSFALRDLSKDYIIEEQIERITINEMITLDDWLRDDQTFEDVRKDGLIRTIKAHYKARGDKVLWIAPLTLRLDMPYDVFTLRNYNAGREGHLEHPWNGYVFLLQSTMDRVGANFDSWGKEGLKEQVQNEINHFNKLFNCEVYGFVTWTKDGKRRDAISGIVGEDGLIEMFESDYGDIDLDREIPFGLGKEVVDK